jgi:hypothetical protein
MRIDFPPRAEKVTEQQGSSDICGVGQNVVPPKGSVADRGSKHRATQAPVKKRSI